MSIPRHIPRRPRRRGVLPGLLNVAESLTILIDQSRHDALRSRIEAGFLGAGQATPRTITLGRLRAGLLWTCLPDFLSNKGWEIQGQLGFDDYGQEIVQPRFAVVELGPSDWMEIPKNVAVFAERGSTKLILGLTLHDSPFGEDWRLCLQSDTSLQEFVSQWERFAAQYNPLRGRSIRPSGKVVSSTECLTWDDLYLDPDLKARIRFQARRSCGLDEATRLRHRIKRRSGFILAGPPGTGKTMIGKILSAELDRTFLWVTPADLSELDDVGEIFDLARLLSPSVLFLEDLDLLAEDRERSSGNIGLGELMNQLDGSSGDSDILSIATTNRLKVLEGALRNRPGRFDRVFEIPPLDSGSCQRFLTSRFTGCDIEKEDLLWLTEKVTGHTGAEIEEIANTALVLALEEVGASSSDEVRMSRDLLEETLQLCDVGTVGSQVGFRDCGIRDRLGG